MGAVAFVTAHETRSSFGSLFLTTALQLCMASYVIEETIMTNINVIPVGLNPANLNIAKVSDNLLGNKAYKLTASIISTSVESATSNESLSLTQNQIKQNAQTDRDALIDFFDLILPEAKQGQVFVAATPWPNFDKPGPAPMKHIYCNTHADLAEKVLELGDQGYDTYFALGRYKPHKSISGKSDGRQGKYVSAIKVIAADVDCSLAKFEAGDGYPTQLEGINALNDFSSKCDFPLPTLINSGGGIHGYWPLAEEVTPDKFQIIADQFDMLATELEFTMDHSRTADRASIMRAPFTQNHKLNQARDVSIMKQTTLIDNDIFSDLVASAHSRFCKTETVKNITLVKLIPVNQSSYGFLSINNLASALTVLDPDCDEPTWTLRRVAPLARAAKEHSSLSEALCNLAMMWSSGNLQGKQSKAWVTPGSNGKTGEEYFDVVWQRFLTEDISNRRVTTLGTIYCDAKEAGWLGKGFDSLSEFQITNTESYELSHVAVGGA